MDPKRQPPVIGLLGAPGSGKSFVASLMAEEGCGVVDADQLSRDALQRPEAAEQLRAWWGPSVIDGDGRVDRQAVSRVVFAQPGELKRLESLVHPFVAEKRGALHEQYRADPSIRAIVEDCPLLLETGLDRHCDRLVMVEAPRAVRLARVAAGRGWDEAELAGRESRQASLDTKRERADDVINNTGDRAAVRQQVRRVLSRVI